MFHLFQKTKIRLLHAFSVYILGNISIEIQQKLSKTFLFFANNRLSKYLIPVYCRLNYKDKEYIEKFRPAIGQHNYLNFQDFFIRKLRKKVEPSYEYIWPCEGLLCETGILREIDTIKIKNQIQQVEKIFGNTHEVIPQNYYYSNVFLHNNNYHRIHAPVSGKISRIEHIPGKLIMLRPWFYGSQPSYPALRNERINLDIDTGNGEKWYLSIVGGLGVGTIILANNIVLGANVSIGNELGFFMIGSTCCILSPLRLENKKNGDQVNIAEEYS